MPKFKKQDNNELKQLLCLILKDENVNKILDSIVNNETDTLWNFVVGYKLIAHRLDDETINDPELGYYIGQFLGYYKAVELLHNKYKNKKEFNSKLDELIIKNENVIDILSDLYMIPSLSDYSINNKYDKDLAKELNSLKKAKVIKTIESPVERHYMLTDEARLYMKEHYFKGFELAEENKEEKNNNSVRTRTLHLLRKQNKKKEE